MSKQHHWVWQAEILYSQNPIQIDTSDLHLTDLPEGDRSFFPAVYLFDFGDSGEVNAKDIPEQEAREAIAYINAELKDEFYKSSPDHKLLSTMNRVEFQEWLMAEYAPFGIWCAAMTPLEEMACSAHPRKRIGKGKPKVAKPKGILDVVAELKKKTPPRPPITKCEQIAPKFVVPDVLKIGYEMIEYLEGLIADEIIPADEIAHTEEMLDEMDAAFRQQFRDHPVYGGNGDGDLTKYAKPPEPKQIDNSPKSLGERGAASYVEVATLPNEMAIAISTWANARYGDPTALTQPTKWLNVGGCQDATKVMMLAAWKGSAQHAGIKSKIRRETAKMEAAVVVTGNVEAVAK